MRLTRYELGDLIEEYYQDEDINVLVKILDFAFDSSMKTIIKLHPLNSLVDRELLASQVKIKVYEMLLARKLTPEQNCCNLIQIMANNYFKNGAKKYNNNNKKNTMYYMYQMNGEARVEPTDDDYRDYKDMI